MNPPPPLLLLSFLWIQKQKTNNKTEMQRMVGADACGNVAEYTDSCIRMRGLPYTTEEADIMRFFAGFLVFFCKSLCGLPVCSGCGIG